MNQKMGMMGEILEQGQSLVGNTQKGVKQVVTDFKKTATSQVTGGNSTDDSGTNESASAQPAQSGKAVTTDQTKQFVNDLYGVKDNQATVQGDPKNSQTSANPLTYTINQVEKGEKTPEELQKIQELRQELHANYYQTLTNPQSQQPEEAVTEKLEREEKEERWELQEKEKEKPPDLPANQKVGTGEHSVGVAG